MGGDLVGGNGGAGCGASSGSWESTIELSCQPQVSSRRRYVPGLHRYSKLVHNIHQLYEGLLGSNLPSIPIDNARMDWVRIPVRSNFQSSKSRRTNSGAHPY